ncbi:MAG: hypothetical protein CUN55_13480 [Phototrophicales bacterium]|nr:MAG: hypothetical protein CUN55_13480 [Phototrophicales bacterium]
MHDIRYFVGAMRSPEFHRRKFQSIVEGLIFQHEQWSGQTVELEIGSIPDDLPIHVKIALYRILQEALSNAYRHADTDKQWVKIWADDHDIYVVVYDKGRGFEPPPLDGPQATEHEAHIGLRGMRDRVAILDGEFKLFSSPGKGTRIEVKVPIHG